LCLCSTKHYAMKKHAHCLLKHDAVKTYWGSGGTPTLFLAQLCPSSTRFRNMDTVEYLTASTVLLCQGFSANVQA